MNRVVVVLLIAAALPFNNFLYGQDIDSLILTSDEVMPGDTAVIQLFLHNQSFSVGGFRIELNIPDSMRAGFASISRGADVQYFGYFNLGPFTEGTAGITGIANMPPVPASPLPLGYHELAIIKIAVEDSITGRIDIPINFIVGDEYANVISDSTGYETIHPAPINGIITVQTVTSLDESGQIPEKFELKGNYPNPFNARTTIEFSLVRPGIVELEIYDIQGRVVRNLLTAYLNSGSHAVNWDGLSDCGDILSSGIYLYRISHNNSHAIGKMSLIK